MDFRQVSWSARSLGDNCGVTCAQPVLEVAVSIKLAAMKICKLVL
jgi:hypothetical protein